MKIAYVANSKIPSRTANSVHVMKMCAAFAAEGNDITLFVPDITAVEPHVKDVYDYYGVPKTFEIMKIKPTFGKIRFCKGLRYSHSVARHISKKGYDCIYGRDLKTCCISSTLFRKPVFFESHAPINKNMEKLFKHMIKAKSFKKMVVITEALKQMYLSQYGLNTLDIFVAPDGADVIPDSIVPTELSPNSKDMFHVGYIGHLYKGRGIELIGEMAIRCPYAFFHIIGGTEEDVLFWKEKHDHIDNVYFYGHVPHSQTSAYGKAMDVLIAPYQDKVFVRNHELGYNTAKWMSPLKVFEYMSMGKPIISSNLSVLREVLEDGVDCVLCPPDDVDKWCKAIQELNENRELADRLSENALTAFEKYTWRQRVRDLMEHGLCHE